MWTRLALLVVLASAVGCATGAELDGARVTVDADVVLSPSPEMVETVSAAAARWSAATGLVIAVGEGGVPVRSVADAVDPSGYRVCALTTTNMVDGPVDVVVDIDPPANTCHGVDLVVAHEIGHVIARTFAPEAGDAHTDSGLMHHRIASAQIDAASLAAVCSFAPCTVFAPEVL